MRSIEFLSWSRTRLLSFKSRSRLILWQKSTDQIKADDFFENDFLQTANWADENSGLVPGKWHVGKICFYLRWSLSKTPILVDEWVFSFGKTVNWSCLPMTSITFDLTQKVSETHEIYGLIWIDRLRPTVTRCWVRKKWGCLMLRWISWA